MSLLEAQPTQNGPKADTMRASVESRISRASPPEAVGVTLDRYSQKHSTKHTADTAAREWHMPWISPTMNLGGKNRSQFSPMISTRPLDYLLAWPICSSAQPIHIAMNMICPTSDTYLM